MGFVFISQRQYSRLVKGGELLLPYFTSIIRRYREREPKILWVKLLLSSFDMPLDKKHILNYFRLNEYREKFTGGRLFCSINSAAFLSCAIHQNSDDAYIRAICISMIINTVESERPFYAGLFTIIPPLPYSG